MDAHPFADFVPGDMSDYARIDLHKHVVDGIVLKAADGRPMHREADLIDVWFDSGSMPYAQWHTFENRDRVRPGWRFHLPRRLHRRGHEQTRGWFYLARHRHDGVWPGRLQDGGLQRTRAR